MTKLKKNKSGQYMIPDTFEPIKLQEIKPGDIILIYGSNILTKIHAWKRYEYQTVDTPPTHACMFIQPSYLTLDPQVQTDFGTLKKYLKQQSTRIDIIQFDINRVIRQEIVDVAHTLGLKERIYDVGGYLYFLSEMRGFKWVRKFVKPNTKLFFCSDAVSYCYQVNGISTSYKDHDRTAPVDSLIYAIENSIATLRTLKQKGQYVKIN